MPTSQLGAIADALHQLGIVILIGGMFFLLLVLRPASRDMGTGEERLLVYSHFFKHLFRWLWFALLLLWVSGVGKIFLSGYHHLPLQVRVMAGAGALMTLFTLLAHFAFYYQMDEAMAAEHLPRAAKRGSRVRKIMAVNLLIGLVVVVLGVFGPLTALS